jgi:integrase
VQRHAHDHSPGRTKVMLTALRAFLRHVCQRGATATDLSTCVPCVPTWRWATVPKYLRPGQVEQVLEACDRRTVQGRRDYAILLLLARLGLRAGEVVALRLEDIEWETGRLLLRSKGGRWTQRPLPAEVGAALAAYLQRDRPRCASRRGFIRLQAPLVGFANSIAISTLVARALTRAGIEAPNDDSGPLNYKIRQLRNIVYVRKRDGFAGGQSQATLFRYDGRLDVNCGICLHARHYRPVRISGHVEF